jgi:ATP-dependent protease ClpP protease subunit
MNNRKKLFSYNAASKSAELLIYDDIGYGITAKDVKRELDGFGEVKNIKIRINSNGGSVTDGFAIYNLLHEHSAYKTVHIDGIAASMASIIAMAGDHISQPSNAFLMIHNPFVYTVGDSKQLQKDAELLDKMKKEAIKVYKTHAKDKTDEEISQMMDDEMWLTGEDAFLHGFIDECTDPAEHSEESFKNMNLPEAVFCMLLGAKSIESIIKPSTPQGENIMRCKHCGKEVATGMPFCGHCGKSLTDAPAAAPAAQVPPVAPAAQVPAGQTPSQIAAAADKERNEAKAAERARVSEIVALSKKFNLPEDFQSSLINSEKTLDECRKEILDRVANAMPSAIIPTADQSDKFRDIASKSMAVAAGVEKRPEVIAEVRKQGSEAPGTIQGLIRICLKKQGRISDNRIHSLLPADLAQEAFHMASQGSSDLTAILADVANKSLLKGFVEAPVTFRTWCGEGEVPDFKTANLVKMSNFSDIDDIPEGMAFKDGRFSDKKETVSVDTKGKKFSLTRQAVINDDLNAFARIPAAIMNSVARRINKDVYDKLTSNTLTGPRMTEDSYYMFDASNHVNLVQTSGVPSVSTIGTAEAKLMMMKLPKPDKTSVQQYTNAPARYLITGTNQRLTVMQLLNTPFDPAKTMAGVYNPYTGLMPVNDAYLQALLTAGSKANAWYLATDPNVIETFVVYYLAGNRTPTLRNQPSGIGEALGISWDIFMDWGIGVPDWRGMVYNDGASS